MRLILGPEASALKASPRKRVIESHRLPESTAGSRAGMWWQVSDSRHSLLCQILLFIFPEEVKPCMGQGIWAFSVGSGARAYFLFQYNPLVPLCPQFSLKKCLYTQRTLSVCQKVRMDSKHQTRGGHRSWGPQNVVRIGFCMEKKESVVVEGWGQEASKQTELVRAQLCKMCPELMRSYL